MSTEIQVQIPIGLQSDFTIAEYNEMASHIEQIANELGIQLLGKVKEPETISSPLQQVFSNLKITVQTDMRIGAKDIEEMTDNPLLLALAASRTQSEKLQRKYILLGLIKPLESVLEAIAAEFAKLEFLEANQKICQKIQLIRSDIKGIKEEDFNKCLSHCYSKFVTHVASRLWGMEKMDEPIDVLVRELSVLSSTHYRFPDLYRILWGWRGVEIKEVDWSGNLYDHLNASVKYLLELAPNLTRLNVANCVGLTADDFKGGHAKLEEIDITGTNLKKSDFSAVDFPLLKKVTEGSSNTHLGLFKFEFCTTEGLEELRKCDQVVFPNPKVTIPAIYRSLKKEVVLRRTTTQRILEINETIFLLYTKAPMEKERVLLEELLNLMTFRYFVRNECDGVDVCVLDGILKLIEMKIRFSRSFSSYHRKIIHCISQAYSPSQLSVIRDALAQNRNIVALQINTSVSYFPLELSLYAHIDSHPKTNEEGEFDKFSERSILLGHILAELSTHLDYDTGVIWEESLINILQTCSQKFKKANFEHSLIRNWTFGGFWTDHSMSPVIEHYAASILGMKSFSHVSREGILKALLEILIDWKDHKVFDFASILTGKFKQENVDYTIASIPLVKTLCNYGGVFEEPISDDLKTSYIKALCGEQLGKMTVELMLNLATIVTARGNHMPKSAHVCVFNMLQEYSTGYSKFSEIASDAIKLLAWEKE